MTREIWNLGIAIFLTLLAALIVIFFAAGAMATFYLVRWMFGI